LELEDRDSDDRLVELITHLAGCSSADARVALEAVGPRAEGIGAVARALTTLRNGQA
jgi:hypothetical protein